MSFFVTPDFLSREIVHSGIQEGGSSEFIWKPMIKRSHNPRTWGFQDEVKNVYTWKQPSFMKVRKDQGGV